MRIMVTGGTGFVGAHTVKALVDAGHEVRLLVRTPQRIARNVSPLGVGQVDHVMGDMTDADSVTRALEGCDAVVHAAAAVGVGRQAEKLVAANAIGAQVVLDAAVRAGADPVVHVSSVAALYTTEAPMLHAELPPAPAVQPYSRSKRDAEVHARRLQEEGHPIVIVYPGGVIGPPAGDAIGEVNEEVIARQLRQGMMPTRAGALSIIDVRDVAEVLSATLEPGRGPRRYLAGGHFMTIDEIIQAMRDATGRRIPILPVPGALLRGLGRVVDQVTRLVPIDTPFNHEAMVLLTRWVPTDDRSVTDELGITLRPGADSIADSIAGLHAAGMLSDRQVGAAAR